MGLNGAGARLERALTSFMLDVQTRENNYAETLPPFIVNEKSRPGLADEVRALLPNAVDVVVASSVADGDRPARAARTGRSPHELFAEFLADSDIESDKLGRMFAALYDEVMEPSP